MDWLLGKSAVVDFPLIFNVARNRSQLTLTAAGGTLHSASSLQAPVAWKDLGPSPQTVDAPSGSRYYRVRK